MDPKHRLLQAVVTGLLMLNLSGMMAAWIWAVRRKIAGEPLLPPAEPQRVPWGGKTVLLVFLLWLVSNLAVGMTYLRLSGFRKNDAPLSHQEQMLLVTFINGILLILIPPFLRLSSGIRLSDLGIRWSDAAHHVKIGVVAFLLFAPAVYAANGLAILVWRPNKHPLEEMVRAEPSADMALLAFISGVLLAPAAEELVFRGIIQGWIAKLCFRKPDELPIDPHGEGLGERPPGDAHTDPFFPYYALVPRTPLTARWRETGVAPSWFPVALTSLIFALVHAAQWPAPVAIFLLSLGLGTVYQRTGSLVSSFVMHAMFNGFSTLMLFLAVLTAPDLLNKKAEHTSVYDRQAGTPIASTGASDARRSDPARRTLIKLSFSIGAPSTPCYIPGRCRVSNGTVLPPTLGRRAIGSVPGRVVPGA